MIDEGILKTGLGDVTQHRLVLIRNLENNDILTKIIHYPLMFVFRTNAVIVVSFIVSIIVFIFDAIKIVRDPKNIISTASPAKHSYIISFVSIFAIYIIFSIPDKMIFRYMLPIYPFVIYIVAYNLVRLYKMEKVKFLIPIILIFCAFEGFSTYQYSFTYYNPLAGGIRQSGKVINTDQAAAGLPNIAFDLNKIIKNSNASVAVYDSVPFSQYFYGHSHKLKDYDPIYNPVTQDYVIIGVQNNSEYFDISDTRYELYKTYKYRNQTHWKLFKKISQ